MLLNELQKIQSTINKYKVLSKDEIYTILVKEKLQTSLNNYQIEIDSDFTITNLVQLRYNAKFVQGWKAAKNYVITKLNKISENQLDYKNNEEEDEYYD